MRRQRNRAVGRRASWWVVVLCAALILSALGAVDDRVRGLRAGGDDYLPKPYSFSELLARVEVLARRHIGRGEDTHYRVGDLELDAIAHVGSQPLLRRRHRDSFSWARRIYLALLHIRPCGFAAP